jgi:hypothetical protein
VTSPANGLPASDDWRSRAISLAPWPLLLGVVFIVSTMGWLPFWGHSIRVTTMLVMFTLVGLGLCGRGIRQMVHAHRFGRDAETPTAPGLASGEAGADGLRPRGTVWWWRRAPRVELSWWMGGLLIVVGLGLWVFGEANGQQAMAFFGTAGMVASGYSAAYSAARYSRLCFDHRIPFPALF